jgi:hypothetical protein
MEELRMEEMEMADFLFHNLFLLQVEGEEVQMERESEEKVVMVRSLQVEVAAEVEQQEVREEKEEMEWC